MEKFANYIPNLGKGMLLKAVKMNGLTTHAFELPNSILQPIQMALYRGLM